MLGGAGWQGRVDGNPPGPYENEGGGRVGQGGLLCPSMGCPAGILVKVGGPSLASNDDAGGTGMCVGAGGHGNVGLCSRNTEACSWPRSISSAATRLSNSSSLSVRLLPALPRSPPRKLLPTTGTRPGPPGWILHSGTEHPGWPPPRDVFGANFGGAVGRAAAVGQGGPRVDRPGGASNEGPWGGGSP